MSIFKKDKLLQSKQINRQESWKEEVKSENASPFSDAMSKGSHHDQVCLLCYQ